MKWLKANWVNGLFNFILITVGIYVIVLLINFYQTAFTESKAKANLPSNDCRLLVLVDAESSEPPLSGKNKSKVTQKKTPKADTPTVPKTIAKLYYCPDYMASNDQQIYKQSSAEETNEIPKIMPFITLFLAVLGGIVLKISRDANEDIKKHVETANLLDKYKCLYFDQLRINLLGRVTNERSKIAVRSFEEAGISDTDFETVARLVKIEQLYVLSDSLEDNAFDDQSLKSVINALCKTKEILTDLQKNKKNVEFLNLLIDLTQDKYPDLTKSARALLRALKK